MKTLKVKKLEVGKALKTLEVESAQHNLKVAKALKTLKVAKVKKALETVNVAKTLKKGVKVGDRLSLKCATQEQPCRIESISKRINSSTLEVIAEGSDSIENLEVAEVVIKTKKPVAIKDFNDVQELGRFVLVRDENTCAGGIVAGMK